MDIAHLNDLTQKIQAACPIYGVSVAVDTDKSTWRVDCQDSATDAQKAAAQAIVDAYDLNAAIPPSSVTNYQARAALINANLFTQVNTAVQALGTSSIEYQAWEYANQVYRNSPFILSMSAQLGLTSAQVDQLFIAAAQIT